MSDKRKGFLMGSAGKREVRNLLRATKNPAQTIQDFQKSHSLHTMFARAFNTTPKYEVKEGDDANVESLDTDPVLMFLFHLGVSQHEVHKRIADALKSNLEDEIRKATNTEPLLSLLEKCWKYSTTIPELRPVLFAVLKQLGSDTPVHILERLGDRNKDDTLKHAEVWHPLPPLLKRLVWEADWDKLLLNKDPEDPREYLKLVQKTLFAQKLKPWIENYVKQPVLQEAANKPFVSSQFERRLTTTQRRALSKATAQKNDGKLQQLEEGLAQTSKAVTEIRRFLSGGDSPAYRPKLLSAALLILMAHHGTSSTFLGGASDLYCTLLSDILLSSPLPKAYAPVLSLARCLDEVVKTGAMTDTHIVVIQASLRQIYPAGGEAANSEGGNSKVASDLSATSKTQTGELKLLLKKVIASGVAAMKEADPQSLFLNPVTDEIAPGYSNVIQKPMCMKTMEATDYVSIGDWNRDVQLMFANCIAYNSGNAGQWFRGEARRQNKVFKDEIFPQAKKLFSAESAKVVPPPEVHVKRKASTIGEIEPLAPVKPTKRKKSEKDDPTVPSLEALASMLLADPFVMRILLDRVLRSLRIDTLKGNTLPVAHTLVPSLFQLLHLSQFSNQLCAIRGKQYMVPDIGLLPDTDYPIAYQCLREYAPLLLKLFLEADFDKRIASDLHAAGESLPPRSNVITEEEWQPGIQSTNRLHVLRSLVEGALVHVCQPGNSVDASLAQTFPKFAGALNQLAAPNLWEERPFFTSLIQAIVRHKAKLSKASRDQIVSTWLQWIRISTKKKGAVLSAAHECFMILITNWLAMGNLVLPRDTLIKFTQDAVEAVNASEKAEDRKFANVWKDSPEAFLPIKELYERVLKALPEAQAAAWKEHVGIVEAEKENAKDNNNMEVEHPVQSP